MSMFRAAAAVGLTLELANQTFDYHLPLPVQGLSPLAQLGLMFGVAYLIVEIWEISMDVVHRMRNHWRHGRGRTRSGVRSPSDPKGRHGGE